MITVDARGFSCPQPVIMTRQALAGAGKGPVEVLVETGTSRDNVSRLALREGWKVEVAETEYGFRLLLTK